MSGADRHPAGAAFAELIRPFDVGEFFDSVHGRRWLHIPGSAEKSASVLTWAELNRILNMDVWNARTVALMLDGQAVPAPAYCTQTVNRNKLSVLRPEPAKVMGFLGQGASMVLNDIDSLVPAVAAIVESLKGTFHARGAANLYYSRRQRLAFDSHYDRHDVFALQLYGAKRWRIYKGRADNPVEHARFYNVPQSEYDRIKGELDGEVAMSPGDLLYLPRGQCHDALAASDVSVHLTFSCALPTGLQLVQDMAERLIEDSLFRADLPRIDAPEGEAALAARIETLLARLTEIYGGSNGVALAKSIVRGFPGGGAAAFALPGLEPETSYRLAAGDWRVVRRGQDHFMRAGTRVVPLEAGQAAVARWVVERARFTLSDFKASFPDAEASRALDRLAEQGILV